MILIASNENKKEIYQGNIIKIVVIAIKKKLEGYEVDFIKEDI